MSPPVGPPNAAKSDDLGANSRGRANREICGQYRQKNRAKRVPVSYSISSSQFLSRKRWCGVTETVSPIYQKKRAILRMTNRVPLTV
jgi:hypothetical protein